MRLLGFLILNALLFSSGLNAQWERVFSFAQTDTTFYQDIHFFDVDTGYVIVTRQPIDQAENAEYIMFTVNGGVSFDTVKTYIDTNLVKICFPSREVGYITYSSPLNNSNIGVIKTTDGGESWFTLPTNGINQPSALSNIHFYNDTIGVVSRNGYSWITYDGGYDWNQLNTTGNKELDVLDNFILMASGNGFVYSYDTLNTYSITSFLSNASINNQDLKIIEGDTILYVTASGNSGPSFGYPYFNYGVIGIHDLNSGESGVHHFPYQYTRCITRTNNSIYSGNYDTEDGTHRFLKSEDGGYTWWSQQIIEPETPNTLGVRKIVCVNDTVCYGMDGSYLYKTTNGGGPLMELKGLHYSNVEENHMGNDELKIYPNPATDVVHIQSTQKIKQIQVLDLSGKVLLTFADGSTTIDVGHLNSGVYLVKIQTAKNSFIRKFEKE